MQSTPGRVFAFAVIGLVAASVDASMAFAEQAAPPPPPADVATTGKQVVGVATLDGRLYINVGAWLTKPTLPAFDNDDLIKAWVEPALEQPIDDKIDVLHATRAPAALQQWVGAAINGYDANGKQCESRVTRLVIWGAHPDGDAGTSGYLLAELKPRSACKPVIVTERRDVAFLAPRKADAATTKLLRKAFAQLPSYRQAAGTKPFRKPATVRMYRNAAGKQWALVTAAETKANPDRCGNQYREAAAAFTLDDKGKIAAVSEVAVALRSNAEPVIVDTGDLAGSFGDAAFDTGQTGGRRLNTFVTFLTPQAKAEVIERNWYIGCD
ncbi:MAG TPA: hypothetical protein PLF40_16295 [Kofleriaceae bacterium]|nr:hypothetical protein [Kofleriaceae bacterium]